MRASLSLPHLWSRRLDDVRDVARPRTIPGRDETLCRELTESLQLTMRASSALGDCFVFGRCAEEHLHALDGALSELGASHVRRFWYLDRAQHARMTQRTDPYVAVDASHFAVGALAGLRQQHSVRGVSLIMVAGDFAWTLGRVVHSLSALLSTHVSLLVAGGQAALLETMWLDELRRGQQHFDVARMNEPASAWARFRLTRRHYV